MYALTGQEVDLAAIAGLDGAPLGLVDCGSLQAVVSRHESAPHRDRDHALDHARVVAAVGAAVPAVPVRFGSGHADESRLQSDVRSRTAELQTVLGRVGGRVEFTVRATPEQVAEHASSDPAAGPGRSYLSRRLAQQRNEHQAWQDARARLRTTTTSLVDLAVELREMDTSRGPEIAYLVPAPAAGPFRERAAALTDADPLMVLGGPWPPFTFAVDA